ncbi:MAG TPA: BTAD domain-containing putative transcriptional regulator, partial [Thermodesulfobacteriota bacterium]|nr:BTAD domain-containing putative transcriptional regulator [Thermodesulfobacteriota bacterium]
LKQLHEITDGWAAGIVLMMEGIKVRGIESVLSEVHVSNEIFHYFAKEVFEKAESGTKDFLLKTSFFPQMSIGMAQTLTKNPEAKRILSDLSLRNYFTRRHESEIAFYQYHSLFREFLQVLAKERLDSKDLSKIEKEAAMILEANGRIEDAMELLIEAEDWPDVVGLILKHAPKLASQGRGQTLEGWIKSLPESLFEEEPWLLYWAGVCRLPFSPSQSHDFFERAFNQFRSRRNTTGIFLSLSGLIDSRMFGFSDLKPLDQTFVLLDKVFQEFPSFPSPEIEARLTASMLCAIFLRQPQHPDFEKRAERALSLLQNTPDLNVRMQTLQALVAHRLYSGEFSKVESVLHSFHGLVQSPGVTPLLLITLKDLEAFYYWLTAAFEENQKAAKEGLELASTTGVHLMDVHLLAHGTGGALGSGDMEAAEAFIKKMEPYLDQMSSYGSSFYYFSSLWVSLIHGDLSKALSQAELALKSAVEVGNPQTEAYCHIGYALVLHELKREQEALNHLAESRALARTAKIPIAEFMCFLAEAQFAFDKGDEQSGMPFLKKALSIGREKGYVNTYYWRPSVMANLCEKALEANIEVDYVQNLIRKRNLMPDPPPYECEQWPWALKINTLGRFELMKDQEPIAFPSKAPRRTLSLLKAIIASGREGAGEEQLVDTLWADADGDTAKQAFETALHRLRKLLGNEKFILLREGHVKLNPRNCRVDAYAFEQLLDQAEAIGSIPLLEKAIDLYQGTFLADDPGEPWILSYRERLRSKFIRSIRKLGSWFEENGQKEMAIEYYERGLEVESLAEEFYQQLMICFKSLGRKTEALAVYNRCRSILESVLGIEPSHNTKAIYNTLRQGG